jgi:hypothetical protein
MPSGPILVDFLPKKETVNAVHYVQMLQKLQHALCDKCLMKRHTIFQHDNACPHTAYLTLEKTERFRWEVLSHPSYSADLAPLNDHLFGPLNDHMRGQHYKI